MVFSSAISLLHHNERIPREEIEKYISKGIIAHLRKQGVLKESDTLSHITCQECNECLCEVESFDGGVRAYCETYNSFYDLPESYSQPSYKFDTNGFLSLLKEQFDIKGSTEKISTNFFNIGYLSTDHTHIFFSFDDDQNNHSQDIDRILGSNGKALIVVPFSASQYTYTGNRVRPVSLDSVGKFTSRAISWDKEEFEYIVESTFRSVEFTLHGELKHNGVILRDYASGTNQYAFLKTLFDSFGRTVTNETLFDNAKKTVPNFRYTSPSSFAEKTKSNICNKDKETKDIVEKIIVPASAAGSKKGYRMTNPQA
ncbi:hypothetical protein H6758_02510 [Candidatus Nomurabacteria bacterium]|nr:hypothetical protein [Candidatus Nomurabacteria bacterium]